MKQRQISSDMMKAFKEGELFPLLEAVQNDDTLDMELRGSSVNIYYRGGSVFKIVENNRKYILSFDTEYCKDSIIKVAPNPNVKEAVEKLPFYKQAMDLYFHKHPKYEREFQQIIARENNCNGKISGATDYYIVDIEYVEEDARFDMVALKWVSKGFVRKDKTKVSLALIEVKYGDGALKGKAGVSKHLDDFQRFIGDKQKVFDFCKDMSVVFKQKCELGLIDGLNEKQFDVTINPENPEVIFIFANHDPDSNILDSITDKIKQTKTTFPVYIANSSNMGYCIYENHLELVDNNQ